MLVCNFESYLNRLFCCLHTRIVYKMNANLFINGLAFAHWELKQTYWCISTLTDWLLVQLLSLCQSDSTTQSGESAHYTEQDSWLEDSGGTGSDITYWRLCSVRLQPTNYFEVNLFTVTSKKCHYIRHGVLMVLSLDMYKCKLLSCCVRVQKWRP